ncbi:MAG: energy-coupling factor ABC transporter ATP-binding protein [Desulfatiglandales bacterium]
MLFEVRKITKSYGERTVLDIPELDFAGGLIYALLGPNGSGKTTLLEILSLLLPPSTGTIRYNGRIVDFSGNHLFQVRREVVMVHQNPILFSTSVYKNLEFGLRIRSIPKNERKKVIDESLDLVGMGPFAQAEAHRLSGGETQRVAIARALACSPKVIFFDEPTASVDVENQNAIENILTNINVQRRISIIFTSHNLVQATRLSHQVISLFDGRKVPATFENLFSGEIIGEERGHNVCLIHDRVRLRVDTEKRGNVRLSIDPLKVTLCAEQDPACEDNVFLGRLVQLSDENMFVRAVVDIGIPLNLLVPKTDLNDKPLNVGGNAKVLCPPDAVQIF